MFKKVIGTLLFGSMLLLVQSCAHVPVETKEDPWEGFNRAMFSFNSGLDGAILKPVAKGYKSITPTPVQKGVSNFFSNLGEIGNISNNLLQGKWDATASSTWRFIINSTAGWLGIFDVASELGLKKYEEDFGQTLGYWGVSSGPYLVLPFLGPSTVRDGSALTVDYAYGDATDLLNLTSDEEIAAFSLDVIDTRASFLSAESFIVGDKYSFIRDVYLQTRTYNVYDGNIPKKQTSNDQDFKDDSFGDDSWGEEDEDDSWGDESESDDSWGDDSADSWAE
jgi:phospholipid-binding lipoprotein MlaA